MQAIDLITAALQELGVAAPGEALSSADANFGLDKLNRLLDAWNSERLYVYADVFLSSAGATSTYVLTPNHQPHTIGLSGADFILPASFAARPLKISSANLQINTSTPPYSIPLNIRDAGWWAAQRIQQLATSYPTDLYYEPDWPNGSIFLWPIPTTAYPIQLEVRVQLAQMTMNTAFLLPPGYWDAIVYSLAESLIPSFGGESMQILEAGMGPRAARARAMVLKANSSSPTLSTGADGLPSGGRQRTAFDWRTGFTIPR